jgi:hypothetical protein
MKLDENIHGTYVASDGKNYNLGGGFQPGYIGGSLGYCKSNKLCLTNSAMITSSRYELKGTDVPNNTSGDAAKFTRINFTNDLEARWSHASLDYRIEYDGALDDIQGYTNERYTWRHMFYLKGSL